MIVNSYIIKKFFGRIAIITSLTLVVSLLITGLESALSCNEHCNAFTSIRKSLYSSILFVESSIFFAVIASTIWLTITLSRTNQYIIITIYSKQKTIILKSLTFATIVLSVFYVFLFNSVIVPHIQNYISNNENSDSYHIKKVWINVLDVTNDSASGSVYLMKNVGKYLDGYSLDSLSIYRIKGGYLQSYEKFNKPFLTASMEDNLMFIYRDPSGKISRNIEKEVMINDIEVEFKRESHQNNIGFVESVSILFNGGGHKDEMQARIVAIKAIENIAMLFLAVIISLCEFPMYYQRFDGGVRGKALRVLLFSIMCYTSLEILKIIGGGTVSSYLASLTCCIALLFVFLSRLIKHHH